MIDKFEKLNKFSRREKILAAVIALFFLIGIILNTSFVNEFSAWQNNPFSDSRINILLTGYDIDHHNISRTDTIMIASLDTSTRDFNIVSIPRDSRVEIPNRGQRRINSAYAFGGIDLTIETIENLLQVPIDYYINLDYEGFINVVDAMGGVELEIEDRMHYVDEAGDLHIDFSPGTKVLDGEEALKYVRYREPYRADIGRIQRQQKFVQAALNQLFSPGMLIDMPQIASEGLNSVYTNINLSDFIPFLSLIFDIDIDEINTAKLAGHPETIGEANYWILDTEEKHRIVDEYLRGETHRRYSDISLRVYNGSGESRAARSVAEELETYGFEIKNVANADHFNYEKTEITYFQEKNKDTAQRIAQYLGGEVIFVSESTSNPDNLIEIYVGADRAED